MIQQSHVSILRLDRLQPLDPAEVAETTTQLSRSLEALLKVQAGLGLHIEYSTVEGMPTIFLYFWGITPEQSEQLANAAADLLEPQMSVIDVEQHGPAFQPGRTMWEARVPAPDINVATVAESHNGRPGVLFGRHAEVEVGYALHDLAETLTKESVVVTIESYLETRGEPEVELQVRLSVSTPGSPPSLVLRSRLGSLVDDLSFAEPGEPGSTFSAALHVSALTALPYAVIGQESDFACAPVAVLPLSASVHPDQLAGGLRLGHAVTSRGEHVDVTLGAEARCRHIQIVGQTGTGKSTLLAQLAHEAIVAGEGMLVLDPHGTLVRRIAEELDDEGLKRAVFIDLGSDQHVPVNPLRGALHTLDGKIAKLADVFQEYFDPRNEGVVGPRFRNRFILANRVQKEIVGANLSVAFSPSFLRDSRLRTGLTKVMQDKQLIESVEQEAMVAKGSDYGELLDWVEAKFVDFNAQPQVRGILGSGQNATDFKEAIISKKIILVDTSKAEIGEVASGMVSLFYLMNLWDAAQEVGPHGVFSVLIDEAHAVSEVVLSDMLAEARKYGLSLVLSHQFLGQMPTRLALALDGNVGTTIAFRPAVNDLGSLEARFGGSVSMRRCMSLPALQAVITYPSADGTVRTHGLVVDYNDNSNQDSELLDQLLEMTHRTYVQPYQELTAMAVAGETPMSVACDAIKKNPGWLEQNPVPAGNSSDPESLLKWMEGSRTLKNPDSNQDYDLREGVRTRLGALSTPDQP